MGGGASDWRDAAKRGACGLVVTGRRRLLHSAISGLAPVYWLDEGDATYFASRLDPLVRTSRRALSVDWDAWAAIVALRYPLGDRTPFADIRRLRPYSALSRRRRARVETPTWPWVEVEPHLDVDAGADAVVGALHEALAPLEGDVLCPLSGGRDSRMLLCALALNQHASSKAVTVSDDAGGCFEEDPARRVAEALNVPHERIRGRIEDYPREWEERASRVEYQFVDHAWLLPLARRIAGADAHVPDGYAIDTFLQPGSRFFTTATLDTRRPRAATHALFDSLRRFGLAHRALDERFHAPIVDRVRGQFIAAARPLEGHPSQAILSLYATRTVRGISTYPSALLGHEACVSVPGAHDSVVSAMLSVSSADKRGARMYPAIYDRLAPAVGRLPSTSDTPRTPPHLPRRWCSEVAVEAYRGLVADGPLAAHVAPELRSWLSGPSRGELAADLRMGLEGISLFHAWWRRYRDRLKDDDATELSRA